MKDGEIAEIAGRVMGAGSVGADSFQNISGAAGIWQYHVPRSSRIFPEERDLRLSFVASHPPQKKAEDGAPDSCCKIQILKSLGWATRRSGNGQGPSAW